MMVETPRTELRIEIDPALTVFQQEGLWNLYDEAFSQIAKYNPCRQHFRPEEFRDAIRSPKYHLLIGYDGEVPVFFCMLTESFELVPWIEPVFYNTKYPQAIGHRIYIPAIFVNIKHQGMHHFRTMMFTIQRFMEERKIWYAFFDHGAEGPNSALAKMISATPRTKDTAIGMQLYVVVQTFPGSS
jgi:hypothetical protein